MGTLANHVKRLSAVEFRRAKDAFASDADAGAVARELGLSDADELRSTVAASLGLQIAQLGELSVDEQALQSFPTQLIHRRGVFPIAQQNGSITVAISNPFELEVLDQIGAACGKTVEPVLVAKDDLARLIKDRFGVGAETIDGMLKQQEEDGDVELVDAIDWDAAEADEMTKSASVVRLVNEILTEAVEARASDIHLESVEQGLEIRYRIDGVLQRQPVPPEMHRFRAAIISRLKIMARLNIAERRVPQDGRIKLRVAQREVDVRVSIIPMLHGEGIVMRVLDKDRMDFSLTGVGMDLDTYKQFQQLIRLPHGILLVTGPTGSGKTTTLYSALAEIRDEKTKIITTEDPIEYQLPGISQIQVHPKVGLTFAASLRSILRHDPDVVLVGEIRDLETAESAIQASLTGHLVFSTLHTNDAAGAFTRLVDMGVQPYLVSSTVAGVMAQRLVRRLCSCAQQYTPRRSELPPDFPFEQYDGRPLAKPVGCRECRGTGYAGRLGLFELLRVNDEVRNMASEKAPANIVQRAALRAGMQTLRQNGWKRVFDGQTTIDEVLRVTSADEVETAQKSQDVVHQNGHSNGQANGHSNGHAIGHSNGHTNGHTYGHTNGEHAAHPAGRPRPHAPGIIPATAS